MSIAWKGAGVGLAAVALAGIAWASRAPMALASVDGAIVRISLGARPERIERCITQSDEELEKLAPQMRQRVICEGVSARYRLELRQGNDVLVSRVLRGGGLRNDRPIYVFQEVPVPAGRVSLRLDLTRIDTVPPEADHDDDDRDEGRRDEDRRDERSDARSDDRRDEDRRDQARRDDDSRRDEHDQRDEDDRRRSDDMSDRDERDRENRRERRNQSVPAALHLEVEETLEPGEVVLLTYDASSRTLRAVRRSDAKAPR